MGRCGRGVIDALRAAVLAPCRRPCLPPKQEAPLHVRQHTPSIVTFPATLDPSRTPHTAHTAHRTPHTAHRTPHTAHRTPQAEWLAALAYKNTACTVHAVLDAAEQRRTQTPLPRAVAAVLDPAGVRVTHYDSDMPEYRHGSEWDGRLAWKGMTGASSLALARFAARGNYSHSWLLEEDVFLTGHWGSVIRWMNRKVGDADLAVRAPARFPVEDIGKPDDWFQRRKCGVRRPAIHAAPAAGRNGSRWCDGDRAAGGCADADDADVGLANLTCGNWNDSQYEEIANGGPLRADSAEACWERCRRQEGCFAFRFSADALTQSEIEARVAAGAFARLAAGSRPTTAAAGAPGMPPDDPTRGRLCRLYRHAAWMPLQARQGPATAGAPPPPPPQPLADHFRDGFNQGPDAPGFGPDLLVDRHAPRSCRIATEIDSWTKCTSLTPRPAWISEQLGWNVMRISQRLAAKMTEVLDSNEVYAHHELYPGMACERLGDCARTDLLHLVSDTGDDFIDDTFSSGGWGAFTKDFSAPAYRLDQGFEGTHEVVPGRLYHPVRNRRLGLGTCRPYRPAFFGFLFLGLSGGTRPVFSVYPFFPFRALLSLLFLASVFVTY